MAILLDSASLDDAVAAAKLGFVRGITTNPALMARETKEPLAHLARLLEAFPDGPICYQPTRSTYADMEEQARAAAALAPDRVVAKLPATLEAVTLATALQRGRHRQRADGRLLGGAGAARPRGRLPLDHPLRRPRRPALGRSGRTRAGGDPGAARQPHAHPRRQPQDGAAGRGEHPRRRPRHHGAARGAPRAARAPAHGVGGARVRGALGVGPGRQAGGRTSARPARGGRRLGR